MRPVIGVLVEIDNELVAKAQSTYTHAIEKAGGTPLVLPYVDDEAIEHFVSICDGFFFTGGADVDPRRYGEAAKEGLGEIQEYRDEVEFKVFQKVIKNSAPILAICRGAQLVNVAFGGTLYQDIPSEIHTQISHRQSEPKFSTSHDVKVIPNTPLHEITGAERIKANSFHHQSIKTLGEGLEIMALADDGIIEAVYLSGKQYVRAYQWHPERLFDTDKQSRLIFEDFITFCKTNMF